MAALTTGGAVADGHHGRGHGHGSCFGCSGCYGGCFGCYGSCFGCYGGCYGGCFGCYGVSHGCCGCCGGGCFGFAPVVAPAAAPVAPPVRPEPKARPEDGLGAVPAERARLVVEVPADARLYVDDHLTTTPATRRVFSTPAIEPGQAYYYVVRAEVERDGQTVSETRRVVVRPGEEARETFTESSIVAANRPAAEKVAEATTR